MGMFWFGKSKDEAKPTEGVDGIISSNSCVLFSMPHCRYCDMMKDALKKGGVSFKEVDLSASPPMSFEVMKKTGQKTVPQLYVAGQHVGGFSAFQDLVRRCIKGTAAEEQKKVCGVIARAVVD